MKKYALHTMALASVLAFLGGIGLADTADVQGNSPSAGNAANTQPNPSTDPGMSNPSSMPNTNGGAATESHTDASSTPQGTKKSGHRHHKRKHMAGTNSSESSVPMGNVDSTNPPATEGATK